MLNDYVNTSARTTTNTSGKYRFRLVVPGVLAAATTGTTVPSYCSHLGTGTVVNTYNMAKQCIAIDVGTNNYVFMFTTDTEAMSVDDFKAWLTGKNMRFYYPLATTTDTEITNTSLIAELEELDEITMERGINTITVTASDANLPADLELTYDIYDSEERFDKFIWFDGWERI